MFYDLVGVSLSYKESCQREKWIIQSSLSEQCNGQQQKQDHKTPSKTKDSDFIYCIRGFDII